MLGGQILGNEEIIVTEYPEPGLMRREYWFKLRLQRWETMWKTDAFLSSPYCW